MQIRAVRVRHIDASLPCWTSPPPDGHHQVFIDEPVPENGLVVLTREPGLGVRINAE